MCDGRLRHCARLCSYMLRLAVVYTFCTSNRTLASRLHTFARELALRYPLARVPRLLCSLLCAYGLSASKPTEYRLSTAVRLMHGKCTAETDRPLRFAYGLTYASYRTTCCAVTYNTLSCVPLLPLSTIFGACFAGA